MRSKKKHSMDDNGISTYEPEIVDDLDQLIHSIRPLSVDEFNTKINKLKHTMRAKKSVFNKAMGT